MLSCERVLESCTPSPLRSLLAAAVMLCSCGGGSDGGDNADASISVDGQIVPDAAAASSELLLAFSHNGDPNPIYRVSGEEVTLLFSTAERERTTEVAWADADGDGDLDLAVVNQRQGASAEPNRIYAADGDSFAPSWTSDETDLSEALAWGDVDGDGDLDLAVGNIFIEPSRLYENDGGAFTLVWSADEIDTTLGLAFGDYDGDDDLDLAVANAMGQPNRIYENVDGQLSTASVWDSEESDSSERVAWVDYDGDGDVDLSVANADGFPNRVYRNDDGVLTADVEFETDRHTWTLAWADVDGDDDLDVAVGFGLWQGGQIYENRDGTFFPEQTFESGDEGTNVRGLAWADIDDDGDPDLAVATYGAPNAIYRNDDGQLVRIWTEPQSSAATDVAWGIADTGTGPVSMP